MKQILLDQYQMVLNARKSLLEYCATISEEDFVRTSEIFGNGGSVNSLMVHVCNTYCSWLNKFALGNVFIKADPEEYLTLHACEEYFSKSDTVVYTFLDHFENDYYRVIEGKSGNGFTRSTPLELFMHVVTHEFHHKGQILSLTRQWGYVPVDTDVIK